LDGSAIPTNGQSASGPGRDTELDQHTLTARYDYADPENQWIDFHLNGYLNDVSQHQVQRGEEIQFDEDTGLPEVIPAGTERSFDLRTTGFDVWNTSRLDTFDFHHAVTLGGDWFRDEVETTDPVGGGDVYTPSGERQAYGAFVQDRVEYSDWLEVIGALRFDGYSLSGEVDGEDVSSEGERLSPRLTVGVSPFERTALSGIQLYGTYAEGYRSPSVTETLITGLHPAGVVFPFLPNPDLKPETATTYEVGLNFTRDGVFQDSDGIRVKTALFRNDVEDYIGLQRVLPGAFGGDPDCPFNPPIPGVPSIPLCFQYVNVAEVRIDGFEFESLYDAGRFFTGFTATLLDGEDRETGERLLTIPPAQLTARLGFRFLDERLVVGGEVNHVFEEDEIDAPLAEDYTLANLFAFYQPNENVRFDLRLNNIFDEPYANYLNAASGAEAWSRGSTPSSAPPSVSARADPCPRTSARTQQRRRAPRRRSGRQASTFRRPCSTGARKSRSTIAASATCCGSPVRES
jgi:hemoglobin/transferrin/lactoferrin receptor protein